MTMQINPLKVFKLKLNNENIEELKGKAKLIKDIIISIPAAEVKKNRDEFIAFSNELNMLLEDIDDILIKHYIKPLDELFEDVNEIIEVIANKLGEYPVTNLIIKKAEPHLIKNLKEDEFISLDTAIKELNED